MSDKSLYRLYVPIFLQAVTGINGNKA